MATIKAALAAVDRHLGIPHSRSRSVAQRLQEADLLQKGAPGVSPGIEPEEFATLIIALAADRVLRSAAETVREFVDLTPGGAPLGSLPDHLRSTAFGDIYLHVDMAINGPPDAQTDVRRMHFEFCRTWPEYTRHDGSKTYRFVAPGADPNRWQAFGHRTSTTINGAALVDCVRAIFGKDN